MKTPIISAKEAIKVFEKIGYKVVRQKGSYIRMRNENNPQIHQPLTIPDHKTLKPGLLRKLIRQSGLNIEKFTELLKS